ncbi:hypothetical protein HMPREF3088_05420 [Corynebacterium sp. HMSC22B11]|uniref:hypothetical protein n=1 Tax=Corynebacterium sp. HMSC22B11 TaxID=1581056 RepID=UPI0008A406E4|nr:hypothetical protein [Corynebacterium sp. HMSC22B11]OFO13764.1 hypothetical protein HMPREF3088_05420 [Corynebacterium sp. HMSC22B11]
MHNLIPQQLHPAARRVRRFLLSDGVALLVLGLGILARGISYTTPSRGSGYAHPAEAALPMGIWAVIWIVIGVLLIVAAVWHETVFAALALGSGVGLNLLWAGSFTAATVTGDMPRGWVSSVGYISVAVLVLWTTWRGAHARDLAAPPRGDDHAH